MADPGGVDPEPDTGGVDPELDPVFKKNQDSDSNLDQTLKKHPDPQPTS